MNLLGSFNFLVYVVLMMVGFYAVLAKPNLIKKVLGLGLFQTGIFIFYISLGVVDMGTAPIRWEADDPGRARYQQVELVRLIRFGLPALRESERERALEVLEAEGPAAAVAALPELPLAQQAQVERVVVPAARHDAEHHASDDFPYTNPLPHVLILTAIVVSVSTMAVALAIVVNIQRAYGTIETDELAALDEAAARGASAG